MAQVARKVGKGEAIAKCKKGDKGQNQSHNPNPNAEVVCWHCGEIRHLSTECCSNSKNHSGSGGGQHKEGTVKPKGATGKGAGSLEQGCGAQSQPALASSLDLASSETPVRSPRLDPEGCLRWT